VKLVAFSRWLLQHFGGFKRWQNNLHFKFNFLIIKNLGSSMSEIAVQEKMNGTEQDDNRE